jgi:hypothetical protein
MARSHIDDLRGAGRLAVEATRRITDLVEAMHRAIGPVDALNRLSAPVYEAIRGVTTVVGAGIDAALAQLAPLVASGAPGAEREAVLAALNGVLGDYLAATANPLATEMRLVPPEAAGERVVLLIHGSSMYERQWLRAGHDHGAALARDLGVTTVYLRYNSGLHVSSNGRALAALLAGQSFTHLDIVAHSMGGLVARSACHAAELAGLGWVGRVRHMVFLGTPHHGAPLERAGNWIDRLLPVHRYSAPLARLGQIRSAGVTDLRYGNVLDEDWQGHDRFAGGGDRRTPLPLPAGIACHAVAGALGPRLRGDGLVTVESALGRHARPERTLTFTDSFVAEGAGHLDLLGRADVYERLRDWLALHPAG